MLVGVPQSLEGINLTMKYGAQNCLWMLVNWSWEYCGGRSSRVKRPNKAAFSTFRERILCFYGLVMNLMG